MTNELSRCRPAIAFLASCTAFMLVGCGTSSPNASSNPNIISHVLLNGVYIEHQTANSLGLNFTSSGASLYMNTSYDKASNVIYGSCFLENAKYTLIGNTVRLENGENTGFAYAKGLEQQNPVTLYTLGDSGQSLNLVNDEGVTIKFIRQ